MFMVRDVARAFFETKVTRVNAMELPDQGRAEGLGMASMEQHFRKKKSPVRMQSKDFAM